MSIFSKVAIDQPKKSVFDLSHTKRLTCEAGKIIPIFCQYTMPGDKWQIGAGVFGRTLALLAPMMQDVNIDVHFFSVPLRLLWDNFERFISGPEKKNSNGVWPSDPVHPYFTLSQVANGYGSATSSYSSLSSLVDDSSELENMNQDDLSYLWCTSSLADYLGFPTPPKLIPTAALTQEDLDEGFANNAPFGDSTTKFDPFPFEAYQKIYNDWYRDENLVDELLIPTGDDGYIDTDTLNQSLLPLRSRAWKKDYFTSALPWPQRGDDVMLSFTGSVDVDSSNVNITSDTAKSDGQYYRLAGFDSNGNLSNGSVQDNDVPLVFTPSSGDSFSISGITSELTNMSNSTIVELRRAFALQKWFENSARLGSRYIEQMLAHFGVQSSDARLQRAEYIGGFSTPLTINEVVQTSESTSDAALGTLAGKGVAVGGNNIKPYYCEEHCIIMGLLTIRPQSLYQLGIPRQFNMFERFDFPFPEFANIGEQAILKQELAYNNFDFESGVDYSSTQVDTFGYTPRYAEFKYIPNTVHGEFKSTLEYWTMSRKYDLEDVALNEAFINIAESTESNKRPFAYQASGNDDYILQVNFDIKAVRPLPYYAVPGYLDN